MDFTPIHATIVQIVAEGVFEMTSMRNPRLEIACAGHRAAPLASGVWQVYEVATAAHACGFSTWGQPWSCVRGTRRHIQGDRALRG